MTTIAACAQPGRVVDSLPVEEAGVRLRFEELYLQEFPALLAVATALTGDRTDSEDLVQDTMVRAFVRWRRVSVLERPGGWCHRVLSNLCRSWWRRRRTQRRWADTRRPATVQTPEPSADVVAFWSIVRRLPTRPRHVVTLHFAGERTMSEIAAILEVPEGTVRSDIARARQVILEELR